VQIEGEGSVIGMRTLLNSKDIERLLVEAIKKLGPKATFVNINKYVWDNYENDLRNSGDLFYVWHHTMASARTKLNSSGRGGFVKQNGTTVWEIY
jgi:hypothetical protein